jgi:hypothetical protein
VRFKASNGNDDKFEIRYIELIDMMKMTSMSDNIIYCFSR